VIPMLSHMVDALTTLNRSFDKQNRRQRLRCGEEVESL
jgi:hypothetical protein